MNDDVFIRFVDMPPRIKGITTPNPDGTYNVYINARLAYAAQLAALDHELQHIALNHFYDCKAAKENEKEVC